jgi:hypothetical protein
MLVDPHAFFGKAQCRFLSGSYRSRLQIGVVVLPFEGWVLPFLYNL